MSLRKKEQHLNVLTRSDVSGLKEELMEKLQTGAFEIYTQVWSEAR